MAILAIVRAGVLLPLLVIWTLFAMLSQTFFVESLMSISFLSVSPLKIDGQLTSSSEGSACFSWATLESTQSV